VEEGKQMNPAVANKTIFALTILLLTTTPPVVGQNQKPRTDSFATVEKGTLGIVIISSSGIVIAADSRSTRANGSFADTADKIFQLGKYSACTIAGTVSFQDQFYGLLRGFDLPKTIQEYYSSNRSPGTRPIKEEAFWLSQRITYELLHGLSLESPPALADGGQLGTMVIAGYSNLSTTQNDLRMVEGYKLKLEVAIQIGPTQHASLTTSDPTITKVYWGMTDSHMPDATVPFAIFANGNAQVALSILTGDATFRESRNLPPVKKFIELDTQGKLSSMTLPEAVALADSLIAESIHLKGTELGIGGQIDIATITRESGFQWEPGHEPSRKRQPTQNLRNANPR
jgi:hypothetical protein